MIKYILIIIITIAIYNIINIFKKKKEDYNVYLEEEYDEENDEEENIKEDYVKEYREEQYCPYHKKYLLTKNEYYFYRKLKQITEYNGLQILAKIRLADIVEVNKGINKRDWIKYFSKIKSKHIDFAIADNMKIILIIELDDNSHQRNERKERDIFVDNVLINCGYEIIHTMGSTEQIENILYEMNNYGNIETDNSTY